MPVSVIIPALNEAQNIDATLLALSATGVELEVLVVDGGSEDDTRERAMALGARVLQTTRGRAVQLNTGAASAQGDVLWFLHADTLVDSDSPMQLFAALRGGSDWGRFNVRIVPHHPLLRIVAGMMNFRSCLTAVATGDQGIFVRRELFEDVGGFPVIELMEDVAISKRLKSISRPACVRGKLSTSGRRWHQHGIVRTILLMGCLRFAYWIGVSPERLARLYG